MACSKRNGILLSQIKEMYGTNLYLKIWEISRRNTGLPKREIFGRNIGNLCYGEVATRK